MIRRMIVFLLMLCTLVPIKAAEVVDICIYGGTSSGVMAAYTACKERKTVLLVEPTDRIGGLTTGGLGATDIGNPYIMKGYTYRSVLWHKFHEVCLRTQGGFGHLSTIY